MQSKTGITKKKFSIRTAIFSVVLAIALWTLVSLRASYEVVATLPLEIVLPANRSIENSVPTHVQLKIRSTGWHLVNLLYLNAYSRCVVDLSLQSQTSSTINSVELQQGFRSSVPASVVEVLSQEFTVNLGILAEKRVPLYSGAEIIPRQGYIQVGEVQLNPDSVTLRGNVKLLQNINEWRTRSSRLVNMKDNIYSSMDVSDSLSSILQVVPRSVSFSAGIQRSAEITIHDIPVSVNGAPKQSTHELTPEIIAVTLRGGIDQISEITADDIHASVEYTQLVRDTSGSILPRISLPLNIRILSCTPPALRHNINPLSRSFSEAAAKNRRN